MKADEPKSRPQQSLPIRIHRFDAAGLWTPTTGQPEHFLAFAPASIVLQIGPGGSRVLAVGGTADVDRHPAVSNLPPANRHDLGRSLLMPALVNAHTHLDLTHIGPLPPSERGFAGFVDTVRQQRAVEPADIAASVAKGVELSLAGGVVIVGDIGGAVRGGASIEPLRALAASPLRGVSYIEFFALGRTEPAALARLEAALALVQSVETPRVRAGLQPHAPYSVSPAAYRAALSRRDRPLASHVAESPEERRFIAEAQGPQRELLEMLGIWSDDLLAEYGKGRSPVEQVAPAFRGDLLSASMAATPSAPRLLVHLNQLNDQDVQTIAELDVHVAYCPRASEYFRAHEHFGPHRYRELQALGVNVCLGTDSILNVDPSQAARLTPFDDAARLHARDGVAASLLLGMMTVGGARALGVDPRLASLEPDATPAGLVAVPAEAAEPEAMLIAAFRRGLVPRLVGGPF
ncbi:MAG: amidohydrolase family protein [Phycisphaerales bacterium]|nr:amidohydrolase family protein [Phycisphaerales bacterium]